MKPISVFFFISLLLSSAQLWSCSGKQHHVFLLHGVGGSKKTFGSLDAILPEKLPCLRVVNFEYRTGSNLTTYDFAQDFDEFIKKRKASGLLTSGDKISLVMHSQGGIVGSLWLKLLSLSDSEIKSQLSSFITLSTPFWGASTAQIAKVFFHSLPEGVTNPIAPFGRNELKEMTYGSETIFDLAENLDSVFEKFPKLSVLHIGGMKRLYGPLWGEDDVVVPIYSMQGHHYFFKDYIHVSDAPKEAELPRMTKDKKRPFLIVPADHVKLYQEGIADIPASCLKLKDCSHPALRPIIEELSGKKSSGKEFELKKFRITLKIESLSKPFERDDLSIRISEKQKSLGMRLIDRLESPGINGINKNLNYTYDGSIKSNSSELIQMSIFFRNKRLKTYSIPVEAGVSTMVRIQLDGL